MSMKEIAQILGIAVSRVSQIHAATMLKLRNAVGHLDESRSAESSPAAPAGAGSARRKP
jgi:RNA polymerase sigma factor for flagellar operon FliA